MSKPELPKAKKVSSEILDPRFSFIATDPRFRLPSKKATRTKIDKRFSRMLTDQDFSRSATVDRYGRKIDTGARKKNLERLYLPADDDEDEKDEDEDEKDGKDEDEDEKDGKDEDEDEKDEDEDEDEKDKDEDEDGKDKDEDKDGKDEDEDGKDKDEDEDGKDKDDVDGATAIEKDGNLVSKSLTDVGVTEDVDISKKLSAKMGYDPARGGGFSSSEDEDSSDSEVEADEDLDVEFPDLQAAQMTVEMGDISSRFAVVNLDWDNLKSVDLFAVFSSFLPPDGKIHKISIYPSEFGKERMDREETEGPPKEIFAKNKEEISYEDEDDEKIAQSLQKPDDGAEYNDSALRQYQLERLRYFYAVVICSSPSVAQALYEATDGREYLSSANFLDLRFIPDEVEFTDKARDECTEIPLGYRPIEFVTTALQHSKVKLTWDNEPNEKIRKELITRAFSGAPSDINENDLRAYIGSEDDSDEGVIETTDEAPKLSKKELARQRTRVALGLAENEDVSSGSKAVGPVGDMEVTFTAGLASSNGKGVFQNQPIPVETSAERYVRLEKERKARRRERARSKRENRDLDSGEVTIEKSNIPNAGGDKDLEFEDPFFAADNENVAASKSSLSQKKSERIAKREKKISLSHEAAAQKTQLELIMEEHNNADKSGINHFNMNEIIRAEKQMKNKNRKKHQIGKRGGLQEDFQMDVNDVRFGKVFENHEYAIDPSNTRFKPTKAMKRLLEEGRKKRQVAIDGDETIRHKKRKKDTGKGSEIAELIDNIKNRNKSN